MTAVKKFHVSPESLDSAAGDLDTFHAALEALKLPEADEKTFGSQAYTQIEDFIRTWSYGVHEVETSVSQLAVALREASKTYKDGEATVTTEFLTTGLTATTKGKGTGKGKTPPKNGGGGGGSTGTPKKPTGGSGPAPSDPKGNKAQITADVDRITDPRIAGSPDKKAFIIAMAEQTGLNPVVIAAWVICEGGSSFGAPLNFLNVGNTGPGVAYGKGDSCWDTATSAGTTTGLWLEGKYSLPGFGTSIKPIQAIENTAGGSPQSQINAICASGWAGGGETLLNEVYGETVAGMKPA